MHETIKVMVFDPAKREGMICSPDGKQLSRSYECKKYVFKGEKSIEYYKQEDYQMINVLIGNEFLVSNADYIDLKIGSNGEIFTWETDLVVRPKKQKMECKVVNFAKDEDGKFLASKKLECNLM